MGKRAKGKVYVTLTLDCERKVAVANRFDKWLRFGWGAHIINEFDRWTGWEPLGKIKIVDHAVEVERARGKRKVKQANAEEAIAQAVKTLADNETVGHTRETAIVHLIEAQIAQLLDAGVWWAADRWVNTLQTMGYVLAAKRLAKQVQDMADKKAAERAAEGE